MKCHPINNELEYNNKQHQRHFLMKMCSMLQKKIQEMFMSFINYCF